jgi:hypothetical protein
MKSRNMRDMEVNWCRRLGRVLRYPILKSTPIPPNARVDPTSFPEDEFPVRCLKCGYSLNGLGTEGRCPECGEAFERGRLLVEAYVEGRRPRNDRFLRILAWMCWFLAFVAILNLAGFTLLMYALHHANMPMIGTMLRTFMAFEIVETILVVPAFTCLIVIVVLNQIPRDKRRRVRVAIQIKPRDP